MADTTVLDPQAIENLRELSPDTDGSFLRELVEMYLQDTPSRIAEIETALASGDTNLLVRSAHTIKGSSGNFGARDFVKLALEIETLAKAANFAVIAERMADFKAEYARVTAALNQVAGIT